MDQASGRALYAAKRVTNQVLGLSFEDGVIPWAVFYIPVDEETGIWPCQVGDYFVKLIPMNRPVAQTEPVQGGLK